MIRSMTGFGRAEAALWGGVLAVELRCINARHFDLRLRLPRELAALDAALRAAVARHFGRGGLELTLRLAGAGAGEPSVQVNAQAVRGYLQAASSLGRELALPSTLTLRDLLPLPGVAQLREPDLDVDAAAASVLACVDRACEAAAQMRQREGEALARDLGERLARVEKALAAIEARTDEVTRGLRARLARRAAALAPELELDPWRLEQEVVLWAERMDISEETVRVRSHLEQFRSSLELAEPVGRRLEFLLQELGREANTIGSKAQDAPVSREVVEIKTELERIREQVLNVE